MNKVQVQSLLESIAVLAWQVQQQDERVYRQSTEGDEADALREVLASRVGPTEGGRTARTMDNPIHDESPGDLGKIISFVSGRSASQ